MAGFVKKSFIQKYLSFCLFTPITAVFFAENPMDVTVTLRGEVWFWCSTANTFACTNMNWVFSTSFAEGDPFATIGTCRNVSVSDSERFSLTLENGRYGLHIRNVKYGDSGRYACWAVVPEPGGMPINEYSEIAILTVTTPAPIPLCKHYPKSVSVNDAVELTCQVPQDAADGLIRLTRYFEPRMSKRILFYAGKARRGVGVTKTLRLREEDNYGRFVCIAGSDEFSGPNCTLVPLQIPMNVNVQFVSSEYVDDVDGISKVTFECDAEAVPPVNNYSWIVMKTNGPNKEWKVVEIDDRLQITDSGRFLVIPVPTSSETGILVSCTAFNSIGLTETSAPLTVFQCSNGNFVTNLSQCGTYPLTSTIVIEVTDDSNTGDDQTTYTYPLTSTVVIEVTDGSNTGDDQTTYTHVIGLVSTAVLFMIVAGSCFLFARSRKRQNTNRVMTSGGGDQSGPGGSPSADVGLADLQNHAENTSGQQSSDRMTSSSVIYEVDEPHWQGALRLGAGNYNIPGTVTGYMGLNLEDVNRGQIYHSIADGQESSEDELTYAYATVDREDREEITSGTQSVAGQGSHGDDPSSQADSGGYEEVRPEILRQLASTSDGAN